MYFCIAAGTAVPVIAVAVVVVGGGVALASAVRAQSKKKHTQTETPVRVRSIYEELCDRHKLSGPSEQFLRQTAQQLGLKSPALMFVEPRYLKDRCDQGGDGAQIAGDLLKKLFGHVAAETAAASSESATASNA